MPFELFELIRVDLRNLRTFSKRFSFDVSCSRSVLMLDADDVDDEQEICFCKTFFVLFAAAAVLVNGFEFNWLRPSDAPKPFK